MIRTIFRDNGSVRVTTVPGWAFGLTAVGVAALGFLVLLLGAALALLLAPIAIVALLFARWRVRRFLRDFRQRAGDAGRRTAGDPLVIDAEYRVAPEDERSRP